MVSPFQLPLKQEIPEFRVEKLSTDLNSPSFEYSLHFQTVTAEKEVELLGQFRRSMMKA